MRQAVSLWWFEGRVALMDQHAYHFSRQTKFYKVSSGTRATPTSIWEYLKCSEWRFQHDIAPIDETVVCRPKCFRLASPSVKIGIKPDWEHLG